MKENSSSNPELEQLGTHQAGAEDLHITRVAAKPEQIDPPAGGHPGPYDTRTGKYDVNK
jgi:hypothetical protein